MTVEPEPDLPRVAGDADELAQLFQNLVHNAIKYGRERGSVRVSLGWAGAAMGSTMVSGAPRILRLWNRRLRSTRSLLRYCVRSSGAMRTAPGIASVVKICQSEVCRCVVGVGFDGFVVKLHCRRDVSLSKPKFRQARSHFNGFGPAVNRLLQHLRRLCWRLRASQEEN